MSEASKPRRPRTWDWEGIARELGVSSRYLKEKWKLGAEGDPIRLLVIIDPVFDRPFAYDDVLDRYAEDSSVLFAEDATRSAS